MTVSIHWPAIRSPATRPYSCMVYLRTSTAVNLRRRLQHNAQTRQGEAPYGDVVFYVSLSTPSLTRCWSIIQFSNLYASHNHFLKTTPHSPPPHNVYIPQDGSQSGLRD